MDMASSPTVASSVSDAPLKQENEEPKTDTSIAELSRELQETALVVNTSSQEPSLEFSIDETAKLADDAADNHVEAVNDERLVTEVKTTEEQPKMDEQSSKMEGNRQHVVSNPGSLVVPQMLFKGVNFCLCDNIINSDQVKRILVDGGGKLTNYLTDIVTHLISDSDDDPNVLDALEIYEKPVVTSLWVLKSQEAGVLLPIKAFSPLKTQIFTNVVACISKLTKRDAQAIWSNITFHGGSVALELNVKCTHLIASKAEGAKYEKAMTIGQIKIVTPDWVTDSISNKNVCNEDIYHPRLLLSPTSDGVVLRIPDHPHQSQAMVTTAVTTTSAVAQHFHPNQVNVRGLPPNTFITTISGPTMTSSSGQRQIKLIVPSQGAPGAGAQFKIMHVSRHPAAQNISGQQQRPPQSSLQAALTGGYSGPQHHQQQINDQNQPRQVFLSLQQQPQVRHQNQHMIRQPNQGMANFQQQSQVDQQGFMQQQVMQPQGSNNNSQSGQKPTNQVILQQRVQPPVHTLSASQQNVQNQQHSAMLQMQQQTQGQPMMNRFPQNNQQPVMPRGPSPGTVQGSSTQTGQQQFMAQRLPTGMMQQQMVQSPQQQPIRQGMPGQPQMMPQQMYSGMTAGPQVQRVPQVRMHTIRGPGGQIIRTPMQSQVFTHPDGSQQRIFFRAQPQMPGQQQPQQHMQGQQQQSYHVPPNQGMHDMSGQMQVIRQPGMMRQQSWPMDQSGQMVRPSQAMVGHPHQQQMMHPQQQQMQWQQQQQPPQMSPNMQLNQQPRQMMAGQPQMNQGRYPHPDGQRMVRPAYPQQMMDMRGQLPPQGLMPQEHSQQQHPRMKVPRGVTPTANIIPSASPRLMIPKTGGPHASSSTVSNANSSSNCTLSVSSPSALVTPKTKTALANLLNTRLLANNGNSRSEVTSGSCSNNGSSSSSNSSTPTSLHAPAVLGSSVVCQPYLAEGLSSNLDCSIVNSSFVAEASCGAAVMAPATYSRAIILGSTGGVRLRVTMDDPSQKFDCRGIIYRRCFRGPFPARNRLTILCVIKQ